MSYKEIRVAFVLLMIVYPQSLADTIVLKSGERVEGRIALRGPDEVRIETQGGIRRIGSEEILEIIDDPAAPAGAPEIATPGDPPPELTPKPHANCTDCGAKGLKLCSECGGIWRATRRPQPCKRCDASGSAWCHLCHSSGKAFCDSCGGDGNVRIISGYNSSNGIKRPVFSNSTCKVCRGSGKKACPAKHKDSLNRITCEACQGKGSISRRAPCGRCNQGYVYCDACAVLHRLMADRPAMREFFEAANAAARERLDYVLKSGKVLNCGDTADRVHLWLTANSRSPSREIALIRQNGSAITRWLRNLPAMVARNVGFFTTDVPLEVCKVRDGDVLLIKGVVPDVSIRGVHATAELRAKEVAKAIATPFFYSLDQVLTNSPFHSFAVVVLYGKENFADLPEGRVQPEAFAIIVEAEAARLLVRGDITEQEFYRRSQFFCADRDRGLAMGLIRTEFTP